MSDLFFTVVYEGENGFFQQVPMSGDPQKVFDRAQILANSLGRKVQVICGAINIDTDVYPEEEFRP